MEILNIVIIGIISCLAMDIWQRLLKIMYDINPSDWAIVGRWYIFLISKAKIYNPIIEEVPPIKNELKIGWAVHYTVAIMYSIFFYMLLKYNMCNATMFTGFIFGLISVIVTWFFFMPILGKGFFGIKTPSPFLSCSLAIGSHVVIGSSIGVLYQLFGY